ncbi:MAG: hypothetical protein WBB67_12050 [bacterium]
MKFTDGIYFISDRIFTEINQSKKDNKLIPASVLLFILTEFSHSNNNQIDFLCTCSSMENLKKQWANRKNEPEPAIMRELITVEDSSNFDTTEKNLLDVVSDKAINEAPRHTCLLVSEIEYDSIVKANEKLVFIGFEIVTPERLLKEIGIYPFKQNFIGRIRKFIEENCS